VVIDLDPAADPIAGRLQLGAGPCLPFAGWLDLAGAIQRAIEPECEAAQRQAPAESPRTSDTP
jgi:hypothetical protein